MARPRSGQGPVVVLLDAAGQDDVRETPPGGIRRRRVDLVAVAVISGHDVPANSALLLKHGCDQSGNVADIDDIQASSRKGREAAEPARSAEPEHTAGAGAR